MPPKPKVLVLFNTTGPAKLNQDFTEELKTEDWATESDVLGALKALGYPHDLLGVFDNPILILVKIRHFRPDIVFNLVERYNNDTSLDQNIPALLELMNIPYTGCGPAGLILCKNKALSKKVLSYHKIEVPQFAILPRNRGMIRPKRLDFPIFIKPLKEEASMGIAQASFVENDDQFQERVRFIHESMQQDAIAEEYIEGRELYCSVIGNRQLKVFPVRELKFREVPPEEPKFASFKAKWDVEYRKRWGIKNEFADPLPAGAVEDITRTCKKIYRLLAIRGYARLDLRLRPDGRVVFIEANPNPILADDEDLAESAKKAGLPYKELIRRIIRYGLDITHTDVHG